jgi:cytochrome c oxidase subunit 2
MRNKVGLLVLLAGLLMAIVTSPVARSQDGPQRVEITARRFTFTPGEITVKKGQTVVLVLKSTDVGHGLRIRDLGVDMKVKPGGTAEVTITPEKTGDFIGHCSVFCGQGHGSMTVVLHVVA